MPSELKIEGLARMIVLGMGLDPDAAGRSRPESPYLAKLSANGA
jgi:hypothetical protein